MGVEREGKGKRKDRERERKGKKRTIEEGENTGENQVKNWFGGTFVHL